jgi:hypothetical protein
VVAKSADEARQSVIQNWKNTGLPASGGTISDSNASGAYTGFKGSNAAGASKADPQITALMALDAKTRLETAKLLKAAGYLKTATSKYNKTLGDAFVQANQELLVEAQRSGRPTLTLRQFLVENPKTPSGTGSGASNLPSRNVYKYTEADRVKIIDDVSQTLRGQGVTNEDKQAQWYKDLRKSIDNMINTGTLSTTQKVKNPKTGVLEVKTVATPEDVARQDRVGFTNWMFGQLGGANG